MNLHIKSNKVKAHALLLCHGVPGVGNGSFVTRALDSVPGEADSFGSSKSCSRHCITWFIANND